MTITLRKKKLANNKLSLYLDIYHNGKRNYEFLNLYIEKGGTKNKENLELAKQIKNKRETQYKENNFEYISPEIKNVRILDYFKKHNDNYKKKNIRMFISSYKQLESYLKSINLENISINDITPNLCKDFKHNLELKLNGETPLDYFKILKRILNNAIYDQIIYKNPCKDIRIIKPIGIKKTILDVSEIQKLASAKCYDENVKRAFLFSTQTGLRFCDIKELSWSNIDNNKLIYTQSKVKHSSNKAQNIIDLNNSALKLLGKRGANNDKIFKLPSFSIVLKHLRNWSKEAKLDKSFTYHSARHSFGVNLLRSDVGGADVKTVSSLLGHSSLQETEKYTRVIDELKTKAVNNLPEIII